MYKEKLVEFLHQEVGDYSWEYEIELTEEYDGSEYYSVKIYNEWSNWEKQKIWKWEVDFRVSEEKIEVCIYEDHYEDVEYFEWTVKYFWIALLRT